MKLAVIPSLVLLASALAAPRPAPPASQLPLPPASGSLQFEPGTIEAGLDELLLRLAQLTGQELTMTLQTQQFLRQVKEPLENVETVPASEVYSFIEGLLSRQGVVIAPVTGGSRPILGVMAITASREMQLNPLYVGSDSLAELEAHPALLVRALMNLKNIDTRQLQTQLRQLTIDDTGVNQVVPVGELSLLLQGRGTDVASLAKAVLEADEAAGKNRLPAAPKTEEGGAK